MSSEVKVTIEARENGPLVVKGLDELTGPDGEALEVKPVVALCRCGASKTKPFCDGSHKANGFDSTSGTPSGKNTLLHYEGAEVSVTYN
ncbi:MAG: CDGSH iron-sulfur domain-containing protein, partial [Albidovulum sp.]|uniref:CDGSH iron-sulfur domain-containing protein n=1 Tax=Albidovulum sp. TaxID=1872424 RepID=UPI003CA03782